MRGKKRAGGKGLQTWTRARLFNDIVCKHGLPSELISDRDSRFISKFWTKLTRLLGTKLKMSIAFHPQTDGQTERSDRVLADY
jgi:hypothetical protein